MHEIMLKPNSLLVLILTALLCMLSPQAMGQTPPEPDLPQPPGENQPQFITELVRTTELSQERVQEMQSNNYGWGNIMIATRLAERIAANSPEDAKLTLDEALGIVLDARAQGKGFGQIAHDNDLKVGEVVEGQEGANGSNRPRYIADLIEKTELTQDQVDQMRSDGAGWGNIMLSTRLAERIAADSVEPDKLTFEEALEGVLLARAEGKGFGEIAADNDLKLGRLAGQGPKVSAGPEARIAMQAGVGPNGKVERVRDREKEKKQNFVGRFFGMLGFGRREKAEKPPRIEGAEGPEGPNKPEKLEKPERPERLEKPEKPEKHEKLAKPRGGHGH